MIDLTKLFKNTKKETEVGKNEDFFNQRLLELKDGRSFKGHNAAIFIAREDEGLKLSVHHKYFNSHTSQTYNFTENTTQLMFTSHNKKTKWMEIRFNSLFSEVKKMYTSGAGAAVIFKWFVDDYEISVDEYSLVIEKNTKEKGVNFLNHKENINVIKEMQHILSRFKKYYKHVDALDILTNLKKVSNHDDYRDCFVVKKFSF